MALNGLPGQKTFKGTSFADFGFFPHGIHHGSMSYFSGSVRFCKEVVAVVCNFCRRNISGISGIKCQLGGIYIKYIYIRYLSPCSQNQKYLRFACWMLGKGSKHIRTQMVVNPMVMNPIRSNSQKITNNSKSKQNHKHRLNGPWKSLTTILLSLGLWTSPFCK